MATAVAGIDEERDFEYPQREAAFFYGLFLRGHSIAQLRRDIEVPADLVQRWSRETEMRPEQRALLHRVLEYRRNVLAIFDSLIGSESCYRLVQ